MQASSKALRDPEVSSTLFQLTALSVHSLQNNMLAYSMCVLYYTKVDVGSSTVVAEDWQTLIACFVPGTRRSDGSLR